MYAARELSVTMCGCSRVEVGREQEPRCSFLRTLQHSTLA